MPDSQFITVEPDETFTFDVDGRPFTVEGPCTVSAKGIVFFEHGGSYWSMDPRQFLAAIWSGSPPRKTLNYARLPETSS